MAGHPEDLIVKVVLTGMSGAGKGAILREMAGRYGDEPIRAGEVAGASVLRTAFYWPAGLADGRRLRIRLYALSGKPAFGAVNEMLLTGCDGVVFAVEVRPERLDEAKDCMAGLVRGAELAGIALAELPVALHYQGPPGAPVFDPAKMDAWLGISPGTVPRFTVGSNGEGTNICAGVEEVIGRIAGEACRDPQQVAA